MQYARDESREQNNMLAIDLIGTHADDMRYQSSKISLSRGMGIYYSGYTLIKEQSAIE